MLLQRIVHASARLADEPGRLAKRAILVDLLRDATVDELPVALGLLRGEPQQGRVGVGWRTLGAADVAPAAAATLTLADVDGVIDELGAAAGDGAGGLRARLVADLLGRATADEAAYLWRVFAGEVRHGALDGVLTDAVAAADGVPPASLRRAAMFLGDLAAAAVLGRTGGVGARDAVGLPVLHPVQPMLASTAMSVTEAVAGSTVSVEWKLDGARIQAHRLGDAVRLYTRNLNDVTARLPDVVAIVRSFPADGLVLDGEVLGVDERGRPEAFQDTMSSFSTEASRPGLCVWFFDLLHVAHRSLVDAPLSERRAALEALVGPMAVPSVRTDDPTVAEAFARDALAAGHEGVVVKDLDSTYEAGRRGAAWRKVKPVHSVDLVVLGAEWGHGRRRGTLSNLHLGARDPDGDGFVMVGKTFKGLTDAVLAWQTVRLQELAVDRHDWGVTVRPELVVEIALDGVQRSRRYPGGVALRFARVRRYREDKQADEADVLGTLRRLVVDARNATPEG